MLAALPARRRGYVVTLLHLGLRSSELYRLAFADYDIARNEVRVHGTKTKLSDRYIALTEEFRDILSNRQRQNPTDPLCDPWTNRDRDLKVATKKAGIIPFSCNDLRRTFATGQARAGVPLHVLMQVMGHADTRMLSRVYA